MQRTHSLATVILIAFFTLLGLQPQILGQDTLSPQESPLVSVTAAEEGDSTDPVSSTTSMPEVNPGVTTPEEAASTDATSSPVVRFLRGLFGLAVLLGIAWLMSSARNKMPWKLVISAVTMQIALGLFLIKWDIGNDAFQWLSEKVTHLLSFANKGAEFVFGDIPMGNATMTVGGRELAVGANAPGLAFQALPTIIFFSCLMAVLYHLRVMHVVIWALGRIMHRILGVTGAESMAMAANIFVGQTEAPLVVRRFLPTLTRSELMSLMTGGFATVAGSVLAAYIGFLEQVGAGDLVPHLLIASVMSAPAAFAISKIMIPETQQSETGGAMQLEFKATAGNVLDAAATGVSEGLKLYLNVLAMLIAFVAMVALIDWPLEELGSVLELDDGLSLKRIFGWVFAPIAWAMGVDWGDAIRFGSLLGTKIGLNEFLAYLQLTGEVAMSTNPQALADAGYEQAMSPRSLKMAIYALCGFANFASIGIQIGGISPIVPERRQEIISLALRAMIGGALASWMTATIAGMFF